MRYPGFLLLTIVFCGSAFAGMQTGPRQMVVAANVHAARAGLEILEMGGTAVDAAVAVELVLTLVEPQSSGIGGGAFMVHYDPAGTNGRKISAFDGRETAPAAVGPDLFAGIERSRKGFMEAVLGGRSVGTPSVLAMLHQSHGKYGKLPWATLFQPAIRLAEQGFAVSARLHFLINRDPLLKKGAAARKYFFDAAGEAWPVGHVLKNPAYAKSLKLIAAGGIDVFYKGDIARQIVSAVNGAAHNPGKLSLSDLENYQPKERAPVCGAYHAWKICGMPPPSSGGGAVIAILGLLERFNLSEIKPGSLEAIHLMLEAERLAYADRDHYVADSDFVDVPVEGLINRDYLKSRSELISREKSMGTAVHGQPPMRTDVAFGQDDTREIPSTTHFSIIDQWGHVVAMTATVESAFGSRLMAGGFILNNELTDFSFAAQQNGLPVANRVEGGKRPRSSMSPTIVLDAQDRPVLVIGSPGGNSIIGYVAQTVINVLDWNMGIQEAINQPRILTRNGPVYIESGTGAVELVEPLRALGHDVRERRLNSGLHGIQVRYTDNGMVLEGGADPRREGHVAAN